jgi:UDP-glucose 4-epimerase
MGSDVKTVLVTGGAGFVGSWLVRECLESWLGANVVVLDNLVNGKREHVPNSPRVTLRNVDLRDGGAVEQVVSDCQPQVVVHLAALHFIPYCNAHPTETLEVNVVGTQNLLEACRRHEPARLVVASSAAVYPINDRANAEEDQAGPTDIYGLSKWINEKQLELHSRQVGTKCAAARLFNVFGPNETNPHVIPEIVDQMNRGQKEIALGNIKPKRDYIYAADVARALVAIAEKNERPYRVYNVGTGLEYSVEEIFQRLTAIIKRPVKIAVAENRVRQADRMHLLADRGRISHELGWQPRETLDSGLAALWQSVLQINSTTPEPLIPSSL